MNWKIDWEAIATIWQSIAAIVDAIVWPAVVAAVLWKGRKPLATLLDRIASKATKFSWGNYSIELPPVPRMAPDWQGPYFDVRKLTPSAAFDNVSDSLFAQLTARQPADYAVIDLGDGHQWLTSRLFIFALILAQVRGLRAFVFVETRESARQHFVGLAAPDGVRIAVGRRYPWFEAALARAAGCLIYDPKKTEGAFGLASPIVPDVRRIQDLVRGYIEEIQQRSPAGPTGDGWLEFEDPPNTVWERTSWLNGKDVDELLDDQLSRQYVVDSPTLSRKERALAVLRLKGRFGVLVDENRRFADLVDRAALLEQLASDVVEPSGRSVA